MSLLTRLTVPLPGEEKLAPHTFMAALAEYKRGAPGVNLTSISAGFQLSINEQASLTQFLANLDTNAVNRDLVHDVLLLGEAGFYSVNTMKNRLSIT